MGLAIIASLVGTQPFPANAQASGRTYVFFRNRPSQLPSGVVALKVQAPADMVGANTFFEVTIVEPVDGVRGQSKISVKFDYPGIEWCDSGCGNDRPTLGAVDGPAYIFGVFERSGDGPVYFHAFRLRGTFPDWRQGKKIEDYVVDPIIRAQMKSVR